MKRLSFLIVIGFLLTNLMAQNTTFMRAYNFPGMNGGLSLAPTLDGGFVGTGQHENGAGGGCDVYVYKISRCGVLEWYKTYGSGGSDGGKKVMQISSGDFIVGGLWDDGSGSGGGYDYVVTKLDATGNIMWNTVWDINGSGNRCMWVEENPTGIITSGATADYPWGNWNAVIALYNTVGSPIWVSAIGGSGAESFSSVHPLPNGDFIAGGYTTSYGMGQADLLIARFDASGNPIWMNAYGGNNSEGRFWDTEGIPTPDGGYILAGGTNDGGWTQGGMDILIVKIDATGALQWAKTYGLSGDEVAEGITVTLDGGFVVTGYTYSNTNGGRDAFILRIDSIGNFVWEKAYGLGGADRGVEIISLTDGSQGFGLSMNQETSAGSGDYDPMFLRVDSLGECGCYTIASTFVVNDVTSQIAVTPLPLSAYQDVTPNVVVSTPASTLGNPIPNENLLCSACSNLSPSWSINDTTVCHGDTVIVINTTSGPGCFDWQFNGIGFIPSGDTAIIVMDTANGYIQNLTLNIYCGTTSYTLQQDIYVSPGPGANFSYTSQCSYDSLSFLDVSYSHTMYPIVGWGWDFGDASMYDFNQNPKHLYANEGYYSVTLGVVDINGCTDTITKSVLVYEQPLADFTFGNECSYIPISFTDNSSLSTTTSGIVSQWNWDFGDGDTSSIQNPNHLYGLGNNGTYPVKLVVVSDSGCVDSITKNIVVHPKPIANFSVIDDCVDLPANFNDSSTVLTGNIVQWQWDFGDNIMATTQNPSHTYASDGLYNVTLIIFSDSGCTDTVSKTITRYPIPLALFATTDVCEYDSAQFMDLSNVNAPDNITTWLWNFGDASPNITIPNPAHLYQTYGNYNVNLTVISNNGCVDDTTLTINIHPKPIADFIADTPCVNTPPTSFTDLSTITFGDVVNYWQWNFNNGQGNAASQNPQFNFGADGYFPTQLIVQSDFGCVDSIEKTIRVYEKPMAQFTVDTTAFCAPYCVNFSDLSTSPTTTVVNWEWNFGNGESGMSNMATTCYTNASNVQAQQYTVTLIAENNYGCYDTITKNNYITVWPLPLADFTASPQPTDIYEAELLFENYSIGANQWQWNFGDYSPIDSLNFTPTHQYQDSGTYSVWLHIANQYGCRDSTVRLITIDPSYAVFIPNSFTPNGDGINETFFFKGYGIMHEDFEFYIFDRWGNILYQTTDFIPWDGTYKGKTVPQGVYVYKFVCKDYNYIIRTYTGSVSVLK